MITWSKWKTSMTMFLKEIIQKNCLVVNSSFLKVYNKKKEEVFTKTSKELLSLYKVIPTWNPFKFLILSNFFNIDYYIAETDISNWFCEKVSLWVWVKYVDLWILTNIYNEHIDWDVIKTYDDLIKIKLDMLLSESAYKDGVSTNYIINIHTIEIYKILLLLLSKFKNRNINLYLAVDDSLDIDIWKIPFVKKILYYNDKSFDNNDIKEYKLSFNWSYKPASSILAILSLFLEIYNIKFDFKELMPIRGLWRLDLCNINWHHFFLEHIGEKKAFESFINILKNYFPWKKIKFIFTTKYDTLDSKISDNLSVLDTSLKEWIIDELYLYDSLQVRWINEIKTASWKIYYKFDTINKIYSKINSKYPNKVKLLNNRDLFLKEIIYNTDSRENILYVVAINSIESDFFNKVFKL